MLRKVVAAFSKRSLSVSAMASAMVCAFAPDDPTKAVRSRALRKMFCFMFLVGDQLDIPTRNGLWHEAGLEDDPLAFVAGIEHPLAKQKKVTLADLTQHAAILPSSSTFTRQIASKLFQESGLQLQVSMTTNYLETIKMMASIGLGWSVLPASMAAPDTSGELKILKINGIDLRRSLGVVYHPRRTLSRAAQAMLDLLLPSTKQPA